RARFRDRSPRDAVDLVERALVRRNARPASERLVPAMLLELEARVHETETDLRDRRHTLHFAFRERRCRARPRDQEPAHDRRYDALPKGIHGPPFRRGTARNSPTSRSNASARLQGRIDVANDSPPPLRHSPYVALSPPSTQPFPTHPRRRHGIRWRC